MTEFDRRRFLLATGGLLAAGGLTGCGLELGRKVVKRRKGGPLPGRIDEIKSICLQCPAGCGIIVKRVDGVPFHIRGNPDFPTNGTGRDPKRPVQHGGLCPKGVAGLQVLYDPDRIKGPLRRVGTRGAGGWQPVSWNEALETVTRRLAEIRARAPEKVVFMGGRYQGSMEPLVQRFLRAYGSPNDLGNGSVGSDGTKVALEMMQGVRDYPGFDWEHTNYVISFGASWLEAYRPTAYLLRAVGYLRRGRPGMRAKLVHVDPRFSVTSAKADEWVPIRTGTDAALALGIAHEIIAHEADGWLDREFIDAHTHGFEDWTDAEGGAHVGFRRYVLENWPTKRAAEVTGLEVGRIERLAEEFAARRPSFAVGERGTSMQTNGLYTRMAIHALNALVGSVNRQGGVLIQQQAPLRPFPQPSLDEVARRGLTKPRIDGAGTRRYPLAVEVSQALPDAVLSGRPYDVEALFLYYTNPLFSRTNADAHRRALERIPFVVSFSPFMDDSTRYADLVLPDHTYLERWQEVPILPSVGFPVVGVRQPVVERPLYDTRHTGDVILQIGRGLGGSLAEALPWKDYRALMEWRLGGLHEVEGASVVGSPEPTFVKKVERAGGWWHRRDRLLPWAEALRTPSGRFEFYASRIKTRLEAVRAEGEPLDALLSELQIEARGDEAFLPHYEPPRQHGDREEYPFLLNTYKMMARAEGRGANQPWLQELGGVHVGESWRTWLEINPARAKELGIGDGDLVWVESVRGRLPRPVRARHYPGARPDVVNMPFDQGHRGYGHWAEQIGANPNEILVRDDERLSGMATYFGTRVKVTRV